MGFPNHLWAVERYSRIAGRGSEPKLDEYGEDDVMSAEYYFLSTETTRSLFCELHGGRDAAANDADMPDLAVSPSTPR